MAERGRWMAGLLSADRAVVAGGGIVGFLILASLAAPLLSPHDPAAVDLAYRLEGPSARHLLGTDHLGRCVLSRILHGGRWSLGSTLAAVLGLVTVGTAIGATSGYLRGAVDSVVMRVVDVFLAFPVLILALALVGMLGPGVPHLVAALVAVWWARYARVARGLTVSAKEQDYVRSARAIGCGGFRIVGRHILPNILPPVVVLATIETGRIVLAVSALSFLGLGVEPPAPEWGAMLNSGRAYLTVAPHLMIVPGVAIATAVFGFHLLGEGFRDMMDPRGRLTTPAP